MEKEVKYKNPCGGQRVAYNAHCFMSGGDFEKLMFK